MGGGRRKQGLGKEGGGNKEWGRRKVGTRCGKEGGGNKEWGRREVGTRSSRKRRCWVNG